MKQVKETTVQKRTNDFMSKYRLISKFIIMIFNTYKSIVNPIKSPVIFIINWRGSAVTGVPYKIKFPNVLIINPINIYYEWQVNKLPFNKGIENGMKFYLWFYIMNGLCDLNKPIIPKIFSKHYIKNPKIDTIFPYNELIDENKANIIGVNPLPEHEYIKHLLSRYDENNDKEYYNTITNYTINDYAVDIMKALLSRNNVIAQKRDKTDALITLEEMFYGDSIHNISIFFNHLFVNYREKITIKTNGEIVDPSVMNKNLFNSYFRFELNGVSINKDIDAKFMDEEMTKLNIYVDLSFGGSLCTEDEVFPIVKNNIIILEPNFKF